MPINQDAYRLKYGDFRWTRGREDRSQKIIKFCYFCRLLIEASLSEEMINNSF